MNRHRKSERKGEKERERERSGAEKCLRFQKFDHFKCWAIPTITVKELSANKQTINCLLSQFDKPENFDIQVFEQLFFCLMFNQSSLHIVV